MSASVAASRALLIGLAQRRDGSLALGGDVDDVAQQRAAPLRIVQADLGVGFDRPRRLQVGQHQPKGTWLGVAVGLAGGQLGGVSGPEVRAVAGEHRDPLLPGVLDGLGDQMRGVGGAAAGHPDIRRRRAGVLTDHQMRRGGRVTLHTVHRRCVAELDIAAHILRGQHPLAPTAMIARAGMIAIAAVMAVAGMIAAAGMVAGDGERSVGVHGDDGPGVAVGHAEPRVVAAGHDPITGTDR